MYSCYHRILIWENSKQEKNPTSRWDFFFIYRGRTIVFGALSGRIGNLNTKSDSASQYEARNQVEILTTNNLSWTLSSESIAFFISSQFNFELIIQNVLSGLAQRPNDLIFLFIIS